MTRFTIDAIAAGCLAACLLAVAAPAAAQTTAPEWMRPIDELLEVEIVSAGRKQQRVIESAAAVYVLTQEQIRRSGLTSVPELLRLVPGVNVARIDASKWAVSVRGFNGRFANKLLVMVDGRSVYTRMFSGVFWDALDIPVEEIEQIEVVRGPGGSIWGTNAVNGVINIVTRASNVDTGTTVSVGGGVGQRWSAGATHARLIGKRSSFRLFGRATEHAPSSPEPGRDFDGWRNTAGGLRVEHSLAARGRLVFDATVLRSEAGQRALTVRGVSPAAWRFEDAEASTVSWSSVARWLHSRADGSRSEVAFSHEHSVRREPMLFEHRQDVSDLSAQRRWRGRPGHDFVAGASVRHLRYATSAESLTLAIDEPRFTETIAAAFAQHEVGLFTDRLRLTAGAKVEHTAASGANFQPTLRAWWSPDGATAFWAAASRALRTPSRTDRGVRFNAMVLDTAPLPTLVSFLGNPSAGDESLVAYEAGVRTQPAGGVTLDVTGFYNRYGGLLMGTALPPFFEAVPSPHLVAARTFVNALDADTAGGEALAVFDLRRGWQVSGSYALFKLVGFRTPDLQAADLGGRTADRTTPRHQVTLQSRATLPRLVQVDSTLFLASAMRGVGVPAASRLDTRVGWVPRPRLEVSLAVQNILDRAHREFGGDGDYVQFGDVPRSAYLSATWHLGRR